MAFLKKLKRYRNIHDFIMKQRKNRRKKIVNSKYSDIMKIVCKLTRLPTDNLINRQIANWFNFPSFHHLLRRKFSFAFQLVFFFFIFGSYYASCKFDCENWKKKSENLWSVFFLLSLIVHSTVNKVGYKLCFEKWLSRLNTDIHTFEVIAQRNKNEQLGFFMQSKWNQLNKYSRNETKKKNK